MYGHYEDGGYNNEPNIFHTSLIIFKNTENSRLLTVKTHSSVLPNYNFMQIKGSVTQDILN